MNYEFRLSEFLNLIYLALNWVPKYEEMVTEVYMSRKKTDSILAADGTQTLWGKLDSFLSMSNITMVLVLVNVVLGSEIPISLISRGKSM